MICTGRGDPDPDNPADGGCCYVEGLPCRNRWYIAPDGHVYEGPDLVDLGTVDEVIAAVKGRPHKENGRAIIGHGATFVCRIMFRIATDDPNIFEPDKRQALATRWAADPDYAPVQAVWDAKGIDPCWLWTGTGRPQCCFAMTPAANAADADTLDPRDRAVRAAAPGASDPGR